MIDSYDRSANSVNSMTNSCLREEFSFKTTSSSVAVDKDAVRKIICRYGRYLTATGLRIIIRLTDASSSYEMMSQHPCSRDHCMVAVTARRHLQQLRDCLLDDVHSSKVNAGDIITVTVT